MSATDVAPDDRTSPSGTENEADRRTDDNTTAECEIGWIRAILSGLAVLIVGFAASLGGANFDPDQGPWPDS